MVAPVALKVITDSAGVPMIRLLGQLSVAVSDRHS